MLASVVGAALNVLLNWIFIGKYGYYAAGYTTLVCYVAYSITHYIMMRIVCRKYIGKTRVYDLRILLRITGGFLIAGFIGLALYHFTVLRYCFIGSLFIAVVLKRKAIIKVVREILESKNIQLHNNT